MSNSSLFVLLVVLSRLAEAEDPVLDCAGFPHGTVRLSRHRLMKCLDLDFQCILVNFRGSNTKRCSAFHEDFLDTDSAAKMKHTKLHSSKFESYMDPLEL